VPAIAADIEDITRTIWATIFDLPLEPGDQHELGPESSVTSCVQIDGEWHGALVLKCPMSLAETLTQQMFQAESRSDIGVAEVRDALGELANMLGGNVKALLPGPSQISLPAVAVGSDYELSVVGTSEMARISFRCDGEPLLITLLRRSPPSDPATA
jgi:chemotaxis protein CheX